ncbi:DUF11 domain-containing protein [Herbidospora mongoliensis]|uniref:DUF11 domain-containing protein n=1 Tax=Herbidospora mongoliensis TaxID=688067 RepID=UPI00083225C0|nr:DUF11 domain-containing protein [Herbidospora mongoliensis]
MALSLIAIQPGIAAAHAGAEPTHKPKAVTLSIAIDNGHTTVKEGDRLTYTVKIHNTGATDTPVLRLSQTMVPGLKLLSSTPSGTVSAGRIEWSKSLPAGEKAQFSVTVDVGELAPQLQRLAVVACASAKTGDRPIVCATHSDRLLTTTARSQVPVPASGSGRFYAIAGIAALVLACGAFIGRRGLRRRTSRIS